MTSIRVLHIGKYFPPHRGGMEVFLRSLMAEQSRQGLKVTALVHATERTLFSRHEVLNWLGQRLPIVRCARWFTLAFAPFSPSFPLSLYRQLRGMRPQVLHIHMPNPSAFWCLLLPSARRLPWVIHWHSDVLPSKHRVSLRMLYSLYRIPERWMLRRASSVIATSPPYAQTSSPLSKFQARCRVIPLGVDDVESGNGKGHDLDSGPEHAPSSTEPLAVLAVGRLTYYKGFRYLLDAMALAPSARLTLVGNGAEKNLLLRRAEALDLTNRLNLVEDCDDAELLALYESHDLLCLPSIERTEAFGLVLLEAMRSGLPCVVTEVEGSGMTWVIDAPNAGLSVPPEDSAALGKMLTKISVDRAMLSPLRRSARSRFDSLFRISAVTQKITDVYSTICDHRSQ